MSEIIKDIIEAGSLIKNDRTLKDVMIKVAEETGEIAQVVSMITGHTTYKTGQEGLAGEIADLIIAAVDLGRLYYDGEDFEKILANKVECKINKWKEKYDRV